MLSTVSRFSKWSPTTTKSAEDLNRNAHFLQAQDPCLLADYEGPWGTSLEFSASLRGLGVLVFVSQGASPQSRLVATSV
jgi:hypothetical protein